MRVLYRRLMRNPAIQAAINEGLADREHGWWVAAVLDELGFLEQDFGYELAGVHLHFRGTFLRYARPENELSFEHDPEDTGRVFATFTRLPLPADPDQSPDTLSVYRLLQQRDPPLVLPDQNRVYLERSAVLDTLAAWSRGLRDLAPDVLLGDWPLLPATP